MTNAIMFDCFFIGCPFLWNMIIPHQLLEFVETIPYSMLLRYTAILRSKYGSSSYCSTDNTHTHACTHACTYTHTHIKHVGKAGIPHTHTHTHTHIKHVGKAGIPHTHTHHTHTHTHQACGERKKKRKKQKKMKK